ncbi:MAG: helix-turn-helix domain-containing protein [Bacillota bacterium]
MSGGGVRDISLVMGFKRNWDFIREKFRKELAYELIFGNLSNDDEIEKMMSITGVSVMPTVAFVVQADSDIGCCFQRDILLSRRTAVFEKVAEMTGNDGDAIVTIMGKGNILVTMVGDRDVAVLMPADCGIMEKEGVELSKRYARYFKAYLEKDLGFTVTIGIGNIYTHFRNVKNSYNEACQALVSKFYKGNGSIIHFSDLDVCSRERQRFFIDFESRLLDNIRKGDWAKVSELAGRLVETIRKSGNVHPDTIKVRILEMLTVLSRAAIELGSDPGMLLDLKVRAGIEISGMATLSELRAWLTEIIDEICRFVREKQTGTAARAVARTKQYINENYASEISLDELARNVFLSPFYLSRIFSEEADTSITDYVKKVRIGKAQALLMNTEKTIAEVAYAVGYKDPNYFSRVFKSITGKPPHQYRKGSAN